MFTALCGVVVLCACVWWPVPTCGGCIPGFSTHPLPVQMRLWLLLTHRPVCPPTMQYLLLLATPSSLLVTHCGVGQNRYELPCPLPCARSVWREGLNNQLRAPALPLLLPCLLSGCKHAQLQEVCAACMPMSAAWHCTRHGCFPPMPHQHLGTLCWRGEVGQDTIPLVLVAFVASGCTQHLQGPPRSSGLCAQMPTTSAVGES